MVLGAPYICRKAANFLTSYAKESNIWPLFVKRIRVIEGISTQANSDYHLSCGTGKLAQLSQRQRYVAAANGPSGLLANHYYNPRRQFIHHR
jgi:hypothetical protein